MNHSPQQKGLTRRFRALPPIVKIAIWLSSIAVLGALVQTATWMLGLDFNILYHSNGGSFVLLCIGLAALLVMMQADRCSPAEMGLTVGPDWSRRWHSGLALGMSTYLAYVLLAWGLNVYTTGNRPLTAYRLTTGALIALTAAPIAISQLVIFNGYLLGMLRRSYGPLASVALSAAIFAALSHLAFPSQFLSLAGQRVLVSLFLIGGLLGLLRLRYGTMPFPAGLLTGWIFVRRFLRKSELLVFSGDSEFTDWIAPAGFPRQGVVAWVFLAVAIVVSYVLLRRYGETRIPSEQPAVDASFKRVFPFSNIMSLAPLDLWLGRLAEARFRVGLKYLPRLLAILTLSAFNTVLSLPERLLLPPLLRRRKVADPVFIVGVHRSGTTHLHNLLSVDKRFCAPRLYHTMNPYGALFSGWLISPVLGAFINGSRPQDRVKFTLLSPQEEEFAVASMCRVSPYWSMTFPRRVATYDRYIGRDKLTPAEMRKWRRCFQHFLRVVTFWSGGRPLLKSPYNTARVEALRQMFPNAKFIHIYRHPHRVYRSNLHLANDGFAVFQLQDPDERDCFKTRILDNYRWQEDSFYQDMSRVPEGNVAEVRFEDLEQDPLGEIRRLYSELNMEFDAALEERLRRYVASLAGYKKNKLKPITGEMGRRIDEKMAPYIQKWGYTFAAEEPAAQENAAEQHSGDVRREAA